MHDNLMMCQPEAAAAYLRPLKPSAHWHFPVTWSHTPPLRQEQSLLQLMPYLPRGQGWAHTEPFEKQSQQNVAHEHAVHGKRSSSALGLNADDLNFTKF